MAETTPSGAAPTPGRSLADRLHEFGYEPGQYMIKCWDCKQTAIADKRAVRCQACAMAKAEPSTRPPQSGEGGAGGVDLEAIEAGVHFDTVEGKALKALIAEVRRLRSAPSPAPAGLDLDAALDAIDRAEVEIAHICRERWEGREGWKTSIPARPDYDSDLILHAALSKARASLSPRPATGARPMKLPKFAVADVEQLLRDDLEAGNPRAEFGNLAETIVRKVIAAYEAPATGADLSELRERVAAPGEERKGGDGSASASPSPATPKYGYCPRCTNPLARWSDAFLRCPWCHEFHPNPTSPFQGGDGQGAS